MKRFLLSLIFAALPGVLWAQPAALPGAQPVVPAAPQKGAPVGVIQQVRGGLLGPKCDHACPPADCAPACPKTKVICIPEPAIKKIVKINYGSTCEHLCFPKCSLHGLFGHCDKGCEEGKCEHCVYQRKYLVKKVCTTECPTTKCVAIEVPVCETHRGQACPPACVPGATPIVAPGTVLGRPPEAIAPPKKMP